jgi:hypothetical protein
VTLRRPYDKRLLRTQYAAGDLAVTGLGPRRPARPACPA